MTVQSTQPYWGPWWGCLKAPRMGTPSFCWGTHMGNDSVTWRDMIGRNSFSDLNPSDVLLLDFCASHSWSITKTIFEHKSCGHKVVGACCGRPRSSNPVVNTSGKRDCQAEEEVLLGLVSLWDSGSSKQVSTGQTGCSLGGLTPEAKTRVWEEFAEAVENDFRLAPWRFCQTRPEGVFQLQGNHTLQPPW